MKISFKPDSKMMVLQSENTDDIFKLGKLSTKLKNATHFAPQSGDGGHSLEVRPTDLLQLCLTACG